MKHLSSKEYVPRPLETTGLPGVKFLLLGAYVSITHFCNGLHYESSLGFHAQRALPCSVRAKDLRSCERLMCLSCFGRSSCSQKHLLV